MKTTLLSAMTFLLIQAATFAGVDLGFSASSTPYDAYMSPVKRVLGSMGGEDPSLDRVNQLMRQGHGFRYSFTTPYVAATPETTEATRSGDCKAKALWLADKMDASNVRFVVGKSWSNSKLSHAWLMWEKDGRWLILDPTASSRPIEASRVPANRYVPLYSWSRSGTYRHASTAGSLAAVAKNQRAAGVAADRE